MDRRPDKLLQTCADWRVNSIPVSRYVVLQHCAVLRDMVDALEPEAVGANLTVPSVDEAELRAAVDLLHGIARVEDLDEMRAIGARRALDLLGCGEYDARLVKRIWDLMIGRDAFEAVLDMADTFFRSPDLAKNTLAYLVTRRILWTDFVTDVIDILIEKKVVDKAVSKMLMATLPTFFPAVAVFIALLPTTHTDDDLMELLDAQQFEVFLHPSCSVAINEVLSVEIRSKPLARTFSTLANSCKIVDPAPIPSSHLIGSIVSYDVVPHTSIVCTVAKQFGTATKRARLAPWLYIVLDPRGGYLQCMVILSRLDWMGKDATSGFQFRIMAMHGSAPEVTCPGAIAAERIYDFRGRTIPSHSYALNEASAAWGSAETMRAALRSQALTAIRFDIFYSHYQSVLRNPFMDRSAMAIDFPLPAPRTQN